MKTFNLIISHFFRIFLLFLLAFMWLRFYEKNLLLVILYSSLITIALDMMVSLIFKRKNFVSNLKTEETQKAIGYGNYFVFNEKSVAISFFKKLFSTQFEVTAKTNYLFWTKENKTTVFVPLFSYDATSIRDIIKIYNSVKLPTPPEKFIICGNDFDKNTIAFVKSLPVQIVLLNKFDCYEKLMKPTNTFPKSTFNLVPKKQNSFSVILNFAFNKKHAKAWLLSSFLLIFSSFFVKVSIYYLIISSIMLVFAIFSLSNKKFNYFSNEKIF